MLSAIRLPLRFDPAPLRRDVESLQPEEWVPHFNTGIYSGDWSGVALRSVGGLPTQLYPDPTATGGFADTVVLDRCPALAAAVAEFRCPLQAVRLLRLGPGAAVSEHCDYRLGFEDGEIRIHVPVTSNPSVDFELEGRRIPMAPGESWYLNFNLPHRVENRGATARIHLVIDCDVDDWLREALEAGRPLERA